MQAQARRSPQRCSSPSPTGRSPESSLPFAPRACAPPRPGRLSRRRIDPGEDAAAAAVREAWEEIGLEPKAVELVAAIDCYQTVTGFAVTPVVAAIPPDLALSPHEPEVADWFEAPLAFVLDPANHQRHSALFEGRERH